MNRISIIIGATKNWVTVGWAERHLEISGVKKTRKTFKYYKKGKSIPNKIIGSFEIEA